ncbi:hypothetical protein HW560_15705 [Paenibacillus sp. E222]|uniref:hypothetical protein n=1 Tax=Paenibacillus sp. E222 TaxID=2748863 RepID=UPI0015C5D3DB|nr:hypothetical protein [Paenibacillus sp. E222]QLG39392.1 hypothetical protein HW560_15705 [Paenibacillus sp. E222]
MSTEENKEKNEGAKEQAPAKRVATARSKEPEQLIYIGPSIRKDGASVRTNQTFIGGRPAFLQALYDQNPLMVHLFVPVNELAESTKKLKQIGSMVNTAYRSMGEV